MKYIKTYENYKVDSDNDIINYILGVNESYQINESLFSRIKEIADKGKLSKDSIIKLIKKGVLTTTLISSLLSSSPSFAEVYNSIDKDKVENVIGEPILKDNEIDISKSFESGVYKLDETAKQDIKTKFGKLIEYANNLNKSTKGKDGKDIPPSRQFVLTIEASVSLVPNKDKTPVLTLAEKRADETSKFIAELLSGYKGPAIRIVKEIKKGGPEYVEGESVHQQKFKDHQFVRMNITTDKLIDNKDFIGYSKTIEADTKNNIGLDKKFNVKGIIGNVNVELIPGSIPDRVQLFIDGNLVDDSGFFSNGRNFRYKNFKFTPNNILELTKLYKAGSPAIKATQFYTPEVRTVSSLDELMSMLMINTNESYQNLNQEDIVKPMNELIKMFNQGQREFVFHSKSDYVINYGLTGSQGTAVIVVTSVLTKTQFTINVNCPITFQLL